MKKFAAVNISDSSVAYTISPANDADYHSGMIVADGRYVLVEFPVEVDDTHIITNTFYSNGQLHDKLPSTATLVEDKHLVGLPVPCKIQINDKTYDCSEPVAELDFTYIGTYKVTVKALGFFDKTFEVVKA